jgi:hypothetical protein
MLSLSRLGICTGVSVVAVLLHSILRLTLKEIPTCWALGLAVLYVFKVLEQRKSLGLADKHSYYVPLSVTLGEAAEAINATVSHDATKQTIQHRSAVHASLAFSVVAECEWWRDFVRIPLLVPSLYSLTLLITTLKSSTVQHTTKSSPCPTSTP